MSCTHMLQIVGCGDRGSRCTTIPPSLSLWCRRPRIDTPVLARHVPMCQGIRRLRIDPGSVVSHSRHRKSHLLRLTPYNCASVVETGWSAPTPSSSLWCTGPPVTLFPLVYSLSPETHDSLSVKWQNYSVKYLTLACEQYWSCVSAGFKSRNDIGPIDCVRCSSCWFKKRLGVQSPHNRTYWLCRLVFKFHR